MPPGKVVFLSGVILRACTCLQCGRGCWRQLPVTDSRPEVPSVLLLPGCLSSSWSLECCISYCASALARYKYFNIFSVENLLLWPTVFTRVSSSCRLCATCVHASVHGILQQSDELSIFQASPNQKWAHIESPAENWAAKPNKKDQYIQSIVEQS